MKCNCEFPTGAFIHIENPNLVDLMLPVKYPELIHEHTVGNNRFVFQIFHENVNVRVTYSRNDKYKHLNDL